MALAPRPPSATQPQPDPDLQTGLQYLRAGWFDRAEPLFRSALARHGERPDILHFLAVCLSQRGALGDAEGDVAQGAGQGPQRADAVLQSRPGGAPAGPPRRGGAALPRHHPPLAGPCRGAAGAGLHLYGSRPLRRRRARADRIRRQSRPGDPAGRRGPEAAAGPRPQHAGLRALPPRPPFRGDRGPRHGPGRCRRGCRAARPDPGRPRAGAGRARPSRRGDRRSRAGARTGARQRRAPSRAGLRAPLRRPAVRCHRPDRAGARDRSRLSRRR